MICVDIDTVMSGTCAAFCLKASHPSWAAFTPGTACMACHPSDMVSFAKGTAAATAPTMMLSSTPGM
eukprot:CAMPEP_0205905474 /NCGR_PEP_ID=MMETSP1325-20131115/1371_1 /ASSEMBLY_ACC=CAM_ASM_000708 /TAXON_ID=236786 /ORGANISM="Florenciella sp., Strain RCC1007" /LENGTH=66 /DNA_ID=CAMNT_0053271385 /DNA_START=179 /DNA_END=379 /DNA_ORIENTATION=+